MCAEAAAKARSEQAEMLSKGLSFADRLKAGVRSVIIFCFKKNGAVIRRPSASASLICYNLVIFHFHDKKNSPYVYPNS